MDIKINEINGSTYVKHIEIYNKDCDKNLNKMESNFISLNIHSDTSFNKDSDTSFDADYKTCTSNSECEEDNEIFFCPEYENTSCDSKLSVFTNYRQEVSSVGVNMINSNLKNQNINEYNFLCDVCGDLIEITNLLETSGPMRSKQHENQTLITSNTKDCISIESAAVSNKIKCPECGDSVEILKNDFEFLMQIHYQKHSACREAIEMINNFENSVLYHLKNHESKACIPVTIKDDISQMETDDTIKYCPECRDQIEILNSDVEFSLQVHSRKHEDISYNSVTVETFSSCNADNVDYICPECDETITIFNKDVEFSFTRHHQEFHMDVEKMVTARERIAAHETFIPDVFKLLPTDLQINQPFILMENEAMHCKLCNCSIKLTMNMVDTALALNKHLLLDYHEEQVRMVPHTHIQSNFIKKPKNNISKPLIHQRKTCSIETQIKLLSENNTFQNKHFSNKDIAGNISPYNSKSTLSISGIFSHFPENLNVHKEFFKLLNEQMYCCLCLVDINAKQTDVKNHIIDISHRLKFFAALKEQLEDCKQSQVKYLIFLNGQLYCNICKYNLIPWQDFDGICQTVKSHFENITHRL